MSAQIDTYLKSANRERPRHFGRRYDEAGIFLYEPGNTVVAHLASHAASTAAVLAARERVKALPGAENLAFTAASSLHMTLFQGVIEFRRTPPFWPEDLSSDTPIDDMTALYLDRLAGFAPGAPFEVRPEALTPNGLVVVPAKAADAAALRDWRDRLADILGYRHPDHDDYSFHITFAYLIDWLPDELAGTWRQALADILADLARDAPLIALAPPAFCAFDDMNHFEELLVLA